MPDEQSANAGDSPQTTVVPTQVTTETLDTNGNNLPVNRELNEIFDKIAGGAKSSEAISEVMDKKPSSKKQEAKPAEGEPEKQVTEKVTSSHPEDTSSASLGDELTKVSEKKAADRDSAESEKTPAKQEETVTDDELKVLPQDKPKTAKRIQALLKRIEDVSAAEATTKSELAARDAKLKELESQLSSVKTLDPKTEEEIAATKKELGMFRRRYELDKDPEIKQKFDSRIEQADQAIPDILKKNNAGEALLGLIKEEGGWFNFSKSQRLVTMADGSKVSASELADQIVSALPFSDRKNVDSLAVEQISLRREKDRFIEAELKAADEFFKQREEENNRGAAEYQKQVKDAEEAIKKWRDKVAVENSFLKDKPIPPDATPEQKKEIEEENKASKEVNEYLQKSLQTKDIDGMLEIVLDATKFHHEKREKAKLASELAKVKAELKAKADELDSFKKSGRTTTKAGSLSGGGAPPSTRPEKPKSLEDAFAALESAKRSGSDD